MLIYASRTALYRKLIGYVGFGNKPRNIRNPAYILVLFSISTTPNNYMKLVIKLIVASTLALLSASCMMPSQGGNSKGGMCAVSPIQFGFGVQLNNQQQMGYGGGGGYNGGCNLPQQGYQQMRPQGPPSGYQQRPQQRPPYGQQVRQQRPQQRPPQYCPPPQRPQQPYCPPGQRPPQYGYGNGPSYGNNGGGNPYNRGSSYTGSMLPPFGQAVQGNWTGARN